MKIVYLKLTNFIGVKAATGLNEIEFKYDRIEQPIIQLYGKNRCGKTVMIQQHHPFSSINLTGDERNDLDLILPGEIGCKQIVYEVNGDVISITHTYRNTSKSHTVSTSFIRNGEELNSSGGVNSGIALIERYLGINKYTFQFIINGTNLTSFSGMGATQRKTLLNKAMGIDIYDKIHKLATEDYRFTNKLISSLNHTKEYLLSTYGSYESLFATVDAKRGERSRLEYEIQRMKSEMDKLKGVIQAIQQQNPNAELYSVQNSISDYHSTMTRIGDFDPNAQDQLVELQISLNKDLSQLNADRQILMREIDDLYDKQRSVRERQQTYQTSIDDKANIERTIEDLTGKINNMTYDTVVDDLTSGYMMTMLNVAQTINTTCKEITSSLKQEHLEFMIDMINHGIDVSAFLIKEGATIIDADKERSIISQIRSMFNTIEGDIPNDCCSIQKCLYFRTYDAFDSYFKSFQSTEKGKFTKYDLEQMDHAFKNIQTIRRLINMDIPNKTVRQIFSLESIFSMMVKTHSAGIDVDFIKYIIEECAKKEQRMQYISQLNDSQNALKIINERLSSNVSQIDDIDMISQMLESKNSQLQSINESISKKTDELRSVDEKRVMISSVQRVDISQLTKRCEQLKQMVEQQHQAEEEYNGITYTYNQTVTNYNSLVTELDTLEKAFDQFVKTSAEIEQNMAADEKYKAIAEATSSTKGIPVIAIRDTVNRAISTANQLLDVMYDHEIELLRPIIDETNFSLPFRCGNNKSSDIRYGSQSESTLLSLALSLSLASALTTFNIPLVDEIDAYLDISIRDDFILMLEAMMSKLGMEQMFLISHNLQKGQFSHIVKTIDISEIINNSKGGES